MAGGRRKEGSEAETAASRSGGRARPQRVRAEGKALALLAVPPPLCGGASPLTAPSHPVPLFREQALLMGLNPVLKQSSEVTCPAPPITRSESRLHSISSKGLPESDQDVCGEQELTSSQGSLFPLWKGKSC